MVSRDEVVWLYRCLLGREPESEHVIYETMEEHETFMIARQRIMASHEFGEHNMAPVRYRPDFGAMAATKSRAATLALAAIVKNEERNIEVMLRSVLPIVDFVVLVDTGSTDTTVALARHVLDGAHVAYLIKEIAFVDFSQARNEALDVVPGDFTWSLMLDADEHIVPEDYWRLNALLDADVDGWQLPRFNFSDPGKAFAARPYPDFQKRLIRNRSNNPIRFDGAVHEEPRQIANWGFAPTSEGGPDGFIGGPHIHHMGQVNLSLQRWREKHEFYTRLRQSSVPQAAANEVALIDGA